MALKRIIAFADEFGNNSFEFTKEGVSSHFIVASVIINADEISAINSSLESIRKKYFQTGEIKSQKIGTNYKRREAILKELNELKFSIYAVVVDKTKLYGEGFKYKQSFYKYLNGILYKELYRTFPQLELKVDEYGSNDFMRSFKKYVTDNHIRTLFSGSDFNIEKSHNEVGIQLADIVAGTLGYVFDNTKKSEHSADFLNILNSNLISINHFPRENEITLFNELDTVKGDTQDKFDSINFLKLLVRYHESSHQRKYTTAKEFRNHLNVNREKIIGNEDFTNIIGKLRDKGILIASSRNGYKLPTTVAEIKQFIRHGNTIIIPLLRRIAECRNAINLTTNNSLDILDDSEFDKLKILIDTCL